MSTRRDPPTADPGGGDDMVTASDRSDTPIDTSAPATDASQRACCVRCVRPLVDRYHLEIVGLSCPGCAARIEPSRPRNMVGAMLMGICTLCIVLVLFGLVLMGPTLAWLIPWFLLVGPAIGAAVRSGAGPGHERVFQGLAVVLTYFAVNIGVGVAAYLFHPLKLLLLPIFALSILLLDPRGGPNYGLLLYLLLLPLLLWSAWWAASPPPPSPAFSLVRGGANPPRHVLCGACGAGLPRHLAVCPGCGAHMTDRIEPATAPST